MGENFQILIDSRFPGKNQRKSVVSYHLTVISYQFEETTDFMSVVFQF